MTGRLFGKMVHEKPFALALLCLFITGCYLAPTKSLSNAGIYLIATVSLICGFFNKAAYLDLLSNQKVLLLFFFMTVLSSLWGDIGSFTYALKSSLTLLFFLVFIINFGQLIYKHIDAVFLTMVFSATIWATILLWSYFLKQGIEPGFTKMEVGYGAVIQTIRTASIFSVALLIAVWAVVYKQGWIRLLCGLTLLPLLFAVLLLHSRGAVLAFCLGVTALFVFRNDIDSRGIKTYLAGLGLLFFLLALAAFFSVEFNPKGIGDSVRIPIWIEAVKEVYPEKLLIGKGYSKDQSLTVAGVETYTHAHNIFISILRTVGILGLALFIMYLFATVRQAMTSALKPPVTTLLLSWLVAGLCLSFFNGRYPVYIAPDIYITLWLPLALLSITQGSTMNRCDNFSVEKTI